MPGHREEHQPCGEKEQGASSRRPPLELWECSQLTCPQGPGHQRNLPQSPAGATRGGTWCRFPGGGGAGGRLCWERWRGQLCPEVLALTLTHAHAVTRTHAAHRPAGAPPPRSTHQHPCILTPMPYAHRPPHGRGGPAPRSTEEAPSSGACRRLHSRQDTRPAPARKASRSPWGLWTAANLDPCGRSAVTVWGLSLSRLKFSLQGSQLLRLLPWLGKEQARSGR